MPVLDRNETLTDPGIAVFQHLEAIVRLKPDIVEDILPFLVYTTLFPVFDLPGTENRDANVARRNKDMLGSVLKHFFSSFASEAPSAISSMLRVLLFLRAQHSNQQVSEFLKGLDLWNIAEVNARAWLYLPSNLTFHTTRLQSRRR
jgi:hypothetical protein